MTTDEALLKASNALGGIASCATHCPGCQMLADIARRVLREISPTIAAHDAATCPCDMCASVRESLGVSRDVPAGTPLFHHPV